MPFKEILDGVNSPLLSGRFIIESGRVLKNIAPWYGSFLSVGVNRCWSVRKLFPCLVMYWRLFVICPDLLCPTIKSHSIFRFGFDFWTIRTPLTKTKRWNNKIMITVCFCEYNVISIGVTNCWCLEAHMHLVSVSNNYSFAIVSTLWVNQYSLLNNSI